MINPRAEWIRFIVSILEQVRPEDEYKPTIIEATEVKFYVHYSERDLKVICINTNPDPDEGCVSIEIDYNLGMKFLAGEENAVGWVIGMRDGRHIFSKEQAIQTVVNRVDCGVLFMLDLQEFDPTADIIIEIDEINNRALIHYDGEKIQQVSNPPKIYFTREDDPSFLKCAFTLSVNILDKILADNNLDTWPNPLPIKLDDVSDLSVFFLRNELTATLKK